MIVGAIVAGLVIIFVIGFFNTVVGRKNRVGFAFGSIDAMLKKRFDLIPNLISTVERYMTHERETLAELTRWRSKAAAGALTGDDVIAADNQIGKALRTVFAQAENYPELRASENFLHLQGSLNEVEEQLAASRRAYNAAITDYNNACEMFPLSIFASMMGLQKKPWFETSEEERKNVNVGGLWK
jgi:LemA protein